MAVAISREHSPRLAAGWPSGTSAPALLASERRRFGHRRLHVLLAWEGVDRVRPNPSIRSLSAKPFQATPSSSASALSLGPADGIGPAIEEAQPRVQNADADFPSTRLGVVGKIEMAIRR
jgi:hypothetical protein